MNKQFLKININGKDVCVNTLTHNGWEIVNGETYETFINNDFAFYFTTQEYYEIHTTNNGDGDIAWTTKDVVLDELAFYVYADEDATLDNMKILDYPTSLEVTKVCNQMYYNVEEL